MVNGESKESEVTVSEQSLFFFFFNIVVAQR